jgi:hypothetical protein
LKLLLILKILPVTDFKDSEAAVLIDTENAYWKPACDYVKTILEAACDKLIHVHFPAANERSTLENIIDQSQRGEF